MNKGKVIDVIDVIDVFQLFSFSWWFGLICIFFCTFAGENKWQMGLRDYNRAFVLKDQRND